MKKPTPLWVAETKKKLALMGIGYKGLGERIGYKETTIRAALTGKATDKTKKAICEYLGIKEKD